jgi:hypothetical protein
LSQMKRSPVVSHDARRGSAAAGSGGASRRTQAERRRRQMCSIGQRRAQARSVSSR